LFKYIPYAQRKTACEIIFESHKIPYNSICKHKTQCKLGSACKFAHDTDIKESEKKIQEGFRFYGFINVGPKRDFGSVIAEQELGMGWKTYFYHPKSELTYLIEIIDTPLFDSEDCHVVIHSPMPYEYTTIEILSSSSTFQKIRAYHVQIGNLIDSFYYVKIWKPTSSKIISNERLSFPKLISRQTGS